MICETFASSLIDLKWDKFEENASHRQFTRKKESLTICGWKVSKKGDKITRKEGERRSGGVIAKVVGVNRIT